MINVFFLIDKNIGKICYNKIITTLYRIYQKITIDDYYRLIEFQLYCKFELLQIFIIYEKKRTIVADFCFIDVCLYPMFIL